MAADRGFCAVCRAFAHTTRPDPFTRCAIANNRRRDRNADRSICRGFSKADGETRTPDPFITSNSRVLNRATRDDWTGTKCPQSQRLCGLDMTRAYRAEPGSWDPPGPPVGGSIASYQRSPAPKRRRRQCSSSSRLPNDLFAGKILIDAMNYWQPVDRSGAVPPGRGNGGSPGHTPDSLFVRDHAAPSGCGPMASDRAKPVRPRGLSATAAEAPRMGVKRAELRDAVDDECHRDAMASVPDSWAATRVVSRRGADDGIVRCSWRHASVGR
jgi:hypothetical protein